MLGLVNRSIQCFVTDTYGPETWAEVVQRSGAPGEGFEAVLSYDDALTDQLVAAASAVLNKSRREMLEDLGTYLASNPSVEAVRRLLRFSGTTYLGFLHALEDLPGRARLALPELDFPNLEVGTKNGKDFTISVTWAKPDVGYVLMGVLRAMADDYGALVLIEHGGREEGAEQVFVSLLASEFTSGRSFSLAGPTA